MWGIGYGVHSVAAGVPLIAAVLGPIATNVVVEGIGGLIELFPWLGRLCVSVGVLSE